MNKNGLVCIGGHQKMNPAHILMLKAHINYTFIYLTDGTFLLSAINLGVLEKRLADFPFFRTHRSTLINLAYLADFEAPTGDFTSLRMQNEVAIPLSRRKTAGFLKIMELNKTGMPK